MRPRQDKNDILMKVHQDFKIETDIIRDLIKPYNSKFSSVKMTKLLIPSLKVISDNILKEYRKKERELEWELK